MQAPSERTVAVHGTEATGGNHRRGALVPPIEQTSTFLLEDAADVDAVYDGRREGDVYTRYSNPTLTAVEGHLAALEGTEAALVFASGMAAISTALLTHVGSGGRVIATEDLYGGTRGLFDVLSKRFAIRFEYVPSTDPRALTAALARERADVVYLETPTNPTLRLVDLAASAAAARAAGAITMVDSTFATPINSRPHAMGIDLVLHSATKQLGGHSDIMGGAVCGTRAHVAPVEKMRRALGGVMDPHAAFLLHRGLRTLTLRVETANRNALAVAQALAKHARVHAVHYPGLPTHPQHALARRQMPGGAGAVVSFALADLDEAKRFLDALRLVRNAASLGGVETLCSLPLQQSHRSATQDTLTRSGIVPGTVRLAIGIEDAADLVADILQAVDRATAPQ